MERDKANMSRYLKFMNAGKEYTGVQCSISSTFL